MKFTPKSDKEIAEERLLPEGEYGFEISQGVEKTSKAGNEMIELTVRVFKDDGSFLLVTDYLMESMMYKVSHAAKACGLEDKYNMGKLTGDDFVGKTGQLKLGIQKDKNGQYPDKNVVKDYIVPKDGEQAVKPKGSIAASKDKKVDTSDLEDEIPF
jgi:Protein of unknown function (DUF669)